MERAPERHRNRERHARGARAGARAAPKRRSSGTREAPERTMSTWETRERRRVETLTPRWVGGGGAGNSGPKTSARGSDFDEAPAFWSRSTSALRSQNSRVPPKSKPCTRILDRPHSSLALSSYSSPYSFSSRYDYLSVYY